MNLALQTTLRDLVYKSIALYVEMLTAPATCTLNVNEDFVWDTDLVNTQFKSSVHPVFNVDILMNDETIYYSTNLESFEVGGGPINVGQSISSLIRV